MIQKPKCQIGLITCIDAHEKLLEIIDFLNAGEKKGISNHTHIGGWCMDKDNTCKSPSPPKVEEWPKYGDSYWFININDDMLLETFLETWEDARLEANVRDTFGIFKTESEATTRLLQIKDFIASLK